MESSKLYKNLLFVFALEKETIPFASLLSLTPDPALLRNPIVSSYLGVYKSLKIAAIYPKVDPKHNCDSIGSENAAVATYIGINTYNPDLIISAGSSIAFPKEENKEIPFKLGDVCYSPDPIGFIDREIILPSFKDYMVSKYDIIQMKEVFKELGFKEAAIGTTSSFHDFSGVFSIKKGVDLQEMEGAAIQKIAYLMNKPFFALKIVIFLTLGKEGSKEIEASFFEKVDQRAQSFAVELQKMLDVMTKE